MYASVRGEAASAEALRRFFVNYAYCAPLPRLAPEAHAPGTQAGVFTDGCCWYAARPSGDGQRTFFPMLCLTDQWASGHADVIYAQPTHESHYDVFLAGWHNQLYLGGSARAFHRRLRSGLCAGGQVTGLAAGDALDLGPAGASAQRWVELRRTTGRGWALFGGPSLLGRLQAFCRLDRQKVREQVFRTVVPESVARQLLGVGDSRLWRWLKNLWRALSGRDVVPIPSLQQAASELRDGEKIGITRTLTGLQVMPLGLPWGYLGMHRSRRQSLGLSAEKKGSTLHVEVGLQELPSSSRFAVLPGGVLADRGTHQPQRRHWSFQFDTASAGEMAKYQALLQRLGEACALPKEIAAAASAQASTGASAAASAEASTDASAAASAMASTSAFAKASTDASAKAPTDVPAVTVTNASLGGRTDASIEAQHAACERWVCGEGAQKLTSVDHGVLHSAHLQALDVGPRLMVPGQDVAQAALPRGLSPGLTALWRTGRFTQCSVQGGRKVHAEVRVCDVEREMGPQGDRRASVLVAKLHTQAAPGAIKATPVPADPALVWMCTLERSHASGAQLQADLLAELQRKFGLTLTLGGPTYFASRSICLRQTLRAADLQALDTALQAQLHALGAQALEDQAELPRGSVMALRRGLQRPARGPSTAAASPAKAGARPAAAPTAFAQRSAAVIDFMELGGVGAAALVRALLPGHPLQVTGSSDAYAQPVQLVRQHTLQYSAPLQPSAGTAAVRSRFADVAQALEEVEAVRQMARQDSLQSPQIRRQRDTLCARAQKTLRALLHTAHLDAPGLVALQRTLLPQLSSPASWAPAAIDAAINDFLSARRGHPGDWGSGLSAIDAASKLLQSAGVHGAAATPPSARRQAQQELGALRSRLYENMFFSDTARRALYLRIDQLAAQL
jgi:hypothetical protein